MRYLFLLTVILLPIKGLPNDKPAYELFDKYGRHVDYNQLLEAASQKMVVLFGELHDNPISHWLQYELAGDLYEKAGRHFRIGFEMFETDNQLIIDEYLAELISTSSFESEVRLWNNYPTDYKPLLEFAFENNIPVYATNIPRRYAAMVHKGGFGALDSLSLQALQYIAPLPIAFEPELPSYKAMTEMPGMGSHQTGNLVKAQAVKDATMAYFIYRNIDRNGIFLHINGVWHSDFFEGIVWYLKQMDEKLPLFTISTVQQDQLEYLEEEHLEKADIIIVVPSSMTKTY